MASIAEINARLDPNYSLQMFKLKESIYAKYQISNNNNNAAYEREQYKSDREDARLEKKINAEHEIERTRGKNSTDLAELEHKNALSRMEEGLRQDITKSRLAFIDNSIFRLMDEDSARWASSRAQMEKNTAVMGDVFKMFASAVFQELGEQNRHTRDIEKLEKESSLRRADAYWNSLCSYLFSLLSQNKEREAKREIDKLIEQWNVA